MINLGIYCPRWMLANHNTDYKIVKTFNRLPQFVDVNTAFVACSAYTIDVNLNRIIARLTGKSKVSIQHGLLKGHADTDIIYHYGNPVFPELFYRKMGDKPVIVTTGFMTDQYVAEEFGTCYNRQKEADELASIVDKASMIHFHTEGGRDRFLYYQPDFKEKTIAIPFFLPNLPKFENLKKAQRHTQEVIRILFVGYEGYRKGLAEVIEALDLLGEEYLSSFNVEVTIVSKNKPEPKTSFPLIWHKKLSPDHIIRLMQNASIFVLVPKRESYGLVLLEAMMAGCAIVADHDDTRTEILGNAGVLLKSTVPASIAAALRTLIEDHSFREVLGKEATARAKKKFHPNEVALQYENCFKDIMKESRANQVHFTAAS